jgi:hypothetical protein
MHLSIVISWFPYHVDTTFALTKIYPHSHGSTAHASEKTDLDDHTHHSHPDARNQLALSKECELDRPETGQRKDL